MTRSTRTLLTSTAAATLVALVSGCSAPTPAVSDSATPTPAVSATEPAIDDAPTALVADYLDAIASGDAAAAFALLSPEAQATYNSSPETFAEYSDLDGTVTSAEAAGFATTELTSSPGPEGAWQLVSAQTTDAADAWIVRESSAGLRIDDYGIPPTGDAPYEWRNPDAGPEDSGESGAYDPGTAPTIYYPYFYGPGGETDVIAEPPTSTFGYLDGVEVTVRVDVASGAGTEYVAEIPAGSEGSALTVVWDPDNESPLWRSSTVLLG
jgi:hypothetical protein